VPTGRFLLLLGSLCLIVVVLAHIAEAFDILPEMGWGQPNSIGHYLDLASAVLGCILVSLAFVMMWWARER
jgi:hypothetical protein